MIAVRADDLALRALTDELARRHDTLARAVHLRALLQLPLHASHGGCVPQSTARTEVEQLAASLPQMKGWRLSRNFSLDDLVFSSIAEATAMDVCERFHYLASHRSNGRSYALIAPDESVVALGVTTDCDIDFLSQCADSQFGDPEPRVLARVFAFEGAPPNSLTRLFKLIRLAESQAGATSIVTYVNPNMGFKGASYRAGGWTLIGEEAGTTYRYLDGRYITDRELVRRVGQSEIHESILRHTLGHRYEHSIMTLEPLQIYGRHT